MLDVRDFMYQVSHSPKGVFMSHHLKAAIGKLPPFELFPVAALDQRITRRRLPKTSP